MGALCDRICGFQAGCDLNMPGGSEFMEKATLEAVKNGTLDEKDIDASVERILRLAFQTQRRENSDTFAPDAHHDLARRVAEAGAVLLKNEGGILPAKAAKTAKVAVVAAGLPDSYESEGFDRPGMAMPEGRVRMIEAASSPRVGPSFTMM